MPKPNYWDQFELETYDDPATNYWDQFEKEEPEEEEEEEEEEEDSGWGSFGSGYGLPSLRDIGTTALKIPGQLGDMLVGGLDIAQAPWRSIAPGTPAVSTMMRDYLGYDPKMLENYIGSYESPELKAAKKDIGQAKGFTNSINEYWENPGVAALTLEESLPAMYAGGEIGAGLKALGVAARWAAPVGEAVVGAASQAAQIRNDMGDFRPSDALYATGTGIGTGLISRFGGAAAEKMGFPDIDTMLADKAIRGTRRLPLLAGAGLSEGFLEELPQSVQEQVMLNLAEGKPWDEGIPQAAIGGTIGGLAMGGVLPAFRRSPSTPPLDDYTQQEFDFGPPDPVQQQLPFDPVQGPQSQPSKIWPGIDPRTGRFRKIYPEATVQGELPLEPTTNEVGQISLDFGDAGGPRAKPAPEPAGEALLRSPLEMIGDESGQSDFMRMWNTLKQLLGREPSIPEVNEALAQEQTSAAGTGEVTGRVASMPASAQDALTTILNNPGNDPVVDASANDFQLRVSKSTNPQELTGLLHIIEMHPRQDAITRGLADVVRQRLNTIQPEVRYAAPDPLAAIPNPEGRGNFGNEAWEETEDDALRGGPVGVVPPPPSGPNIAAFPPQPTVEDRQVESFRKGMLGDVQSRAEQLQQRAAELKQQYPSVPDEWIRRVVTAENNIARHSQSPNVNTPFVQQMIADNQRRIDLMNHRMQSYEAAYNPGPQGIASRNPDLFTDDEARTLIDRAFPPPAPEPQPATEYGQNPLDEEALQYWRNQDRIIAENQARNGPLMGPTGRVAYFNDPIAAMDRLTDEDLRYLDQFDDFGRPIGGRRPTPPPAGYDPIQPVSSNLPNDPLIPFEPESLENYAQPGLPFSETQPNLPFSPAMDERLPANAPAPAVESLPPADMRQPRLNLKSKAYWDKRNIKVSKEVKRIADQAVTNLIPEDLEKGLSYEYSRMILDDIDPGKPGFEVLGDDGPNSRIELIYRGPDGEAVAYAKLYTPGEDEPGGAVEVTSFASDKTKPFLQAKGVHRILKEFVRLGADRPYAAYSPYTKNFMDKARRFLDDEEGSLDIGAIGEEFNRFKTSAVEVLNKGDKLRDLSTKLMSHKTNQVVLNETTRLIKDETGAMPIPSWSGIKQATGWGQGKSKPTPSPGPQYNPLHEMIMLPAGATTTLDMSAPGRQGIGLIHTPQYWKALLNMPRGLLYSEFDKIDKQLRSKQIFQPIWNPVTQRYGPSVAEKAGLQLMVPASSIAPGIRAQQIASKWLETGGFLGPEYIKGVKNPIRATYFHTIGYPVRASNRAFITFLNSLRANRFEYLMNRAQDAADKGHRTGRTRMPGIMGSIGLTQAVTKQEAAEMDPYLNEDLAKEIADFVNTATGAGPLKTHALPFRQAEINLEKHATLLSSVFFSPGLMASRVRMLNPNTYVMASPAVRKEYMKSALATGMAWYAFTYMLKKAAEGLGLEDEVTVSDKLTSSDFGKVRIGDFRIDPAGGFQQFIVNIARAWHGGWTTAATGEFHKFGEGFRAETQLSNAQRFLANKMNPVVKFAYDIADADQYAPFHVYDRMAQLAVPLYIQDIYEIVNENPQVFPLAAPLAMMGMGTQMYGKGESIGKLVPEENDWLAGGGGGIRSLMPWNIGKEDYEVTDFPFQDPDESYFEQFEREE